MTVCNNCKGGQEEYCTSNDPYAGYHGAFHCMATGDGEVAFVRHHTVTQYVSRQNESSTADVSILCAISAICTRVLVTCPECLIEHMSARKLVCIYTEYVYIVITPAMLTPVMVQHRNEPMLLWLFNWLHCTVCARLCVCVRTTSCCVWTARAARWTWRRPVTGARWRRTSS